jgi:hypothetical protein
MKKTKKTSKIRTAITAKKPRRTTADDVKIISEDELVVVTGGLYFPINARDQI